LTLRASTRYVLIIGLPEERVPERCVRR